MPNGQPKAPASNARPHSVAEALRVLDDALGTTPNSSLGDLVTEEFSNLKKSFGSLPLGGPMSGSTLAGAGEQLQGGLIAAGEQLSAVAGPLLEEGKKIGANIDRQVRSNPWPFIAGIGLATFALGFLIAKQSSNTDVKP